MQPCTLSANHQPTNKQTDSALQGAKLKGPSDGLEHLLGGLSAAPGGGVLPGYLKTLDKTSAVVVQKLLPPQKKGDAKGERGWWVC